MKKRLFAFGCSYTHYAYPTWADVVSVNFDEYYNFGRAGCSNIYIMNTLVAAEDIIKFNAETDTVIVMLTGFGRFSYLPRNSIWKTPGDLYNYNHNTKDPVTTEFYNNMWSDNWAVHDSWTAATVIKKLLTFNQVNYKILMGIDNEYYLKSSTELDPVIRDRAAEIYSMLDNSTSLDKWKEANSYYDSPYWEDRNSVDGHPSTEVYLQYAKDFLPELVSDKSIELVNYWKENFDHRGQTAMEHKFNELFRSHRDQTYIKKSF
jgi:hypothetical protein